MPAAKKPTLTQRVAQMEERLIAQEQHRAYVVNEHEKLQDRVRDLEVRAKAAPKPKRKAIFGRFFL